MARGKLLLLCKFAVRQLKSNCDLLLSAVIPEAWLRALSGPAIIGTGTLPDEAGHHFSIRR